MNRQRLTISADAGALHVIAIWQGLQECAANVRAWTAHVDVQRGAESLTLEFTDVSDARLLNVVATLRDSMFQMTATIRRMPEV